MSPRNKRMFVWAVIGSVIASFILIDLVYLLSP